MQKFSKNLKKKVLKKWKKLPESNRNKTQFCAGFGISPRTLNRWLQEPDETANVMVSKPMAPVVPVSEYSYVISPSSVIISKGADVVVVNNDSPNFKKVIEACLENDYEKAMSVASIKKMIETYSDGIITVTDVVKFNGVTIRNKMADKLIEMVKVKDDGVKAFAKFFEELMMIEDKDVVEQLWPFLENQKIMLNEDGTFTGYRAVTCDFMDKRTGTMDNSVGKVVAVPRSEVEKNPNVSCAKGLHVGSYEYAMGFANMSDRIIAVKCHVRDVVSVPYDYDAGKLRCCRFEVVGIVQ